MFPLFCVCRYVCMFVYVGYMLVCSYEGQRSALGVISEDAFHLVSWRQGFLLVWNSLN